MGVPHVPRDQIHEFNARLNRLYAAMGRPASNCLHIDNEGMAAWPAEYLYLRQDGLSDEDATKAVLRMITGSTEPPDPPIHPPEPPTTQYVAPLQGYVRHQPSASIGDDTGPRSVRFCSYFGALGDLRDRPALFHQNLDLIPGRWQGARIFWHLASSGWVNAGRNVSPFDPNFDALLLEALSQFSKRGLRVQLTSGDHQFFPPNTDRHGLYARIAALCKRVNDKVVSISEVINEARVNSHEGEDWAFWASLSKDFQQVYPWGVHGTSDPGDQEEPADLRAASRPPATCTLLHGTRIDYISAIRRAFNVKFEGVPELYVVQGEPNAEGTDVYQGWPAGPQHAEVFGLHTMIVLTGQVLTFFGDAALYKHIPLDSDWGFSNLPRLWREMAIPEDIGLYQLIPGHKPDAPVRLEGIPGNAPARNDNMVSPDGKRGYSVVYGETATTPGQWRLRHKDNGPMDVWTWQGCIAKDWLAPVLSTSLKVAVIAWRR